METQFCSMENKKTLVIYYRMVKSRKINVVDLNEIKSVDNNVASHTETVAPPEETVPEPLVPEPVTEVEPQRVQETEDKPMKKCDEKATCAFCSKVMSVKALRYSHDKNCKGKQPAAVARSTTVKNNSPEPEAAVSKPTAKTTRAEVRQQRLNSLVSQAF
jgi:hypothetical protein